MAANDYSRTVSITPVGTAYAWDTPPSWITITRVGNTDEWTITVAANAGSARSAVLTVRHNNGTTTDTINVTQAGNSPNPTAIPPTATPVPPTPTPTSGSGAGQTLTLVNNGEAVAPLFFGFGGVSSANVDWSLSSSGTVSLSNVPSWMSASVANLASNAGRITLTQTASPISGTSSVITVTSDGGATGSIWVSIGVDNRNPTPTPTSGSGAGPTPTPTTFRLVTPTPTTGSGGGGGLVTPTPTPAISGGGGAGSGTGTGFVPAG